MRIVFFLAMAALVASCGNNEGATGKTFCDTACKSDSFVFRSGDRFEAAVGIGVRNCKADSISWTHGGMAAMQQAPITELTNKDVRLNASAIKCVFQDTSHAWLSFNDCVTGRGYLFQLPFSKRKNITKITGAINSFDPKFAVDEDLRAYTDRGSIFVINIANGKEAVMTFKETYDIDFDKIHEMVDSVNITKDRIFVQLIKQGNKVPLEKTVDLK